MAQLVISNVDDTLEERLRARASRNGHTLEAEVCAILEEAEPKAPEQAFRENGAPGLGTEEKGFGDLMYERFKDTGLNEDEAKLFNEGIHEINSRSNVKLNDDLKERLKVRAEMHGRTLEDEVRVILEEAADGRAAAEVGAKLPIEEEKGFGTRLHEHFKDMGLTKEEREHFEEGIRRLWSSTPRRFVDFER
jgi:plasmid stability protein